MIPPVVQALQQYFAHYGYWTLAVALFLESAGVPAPGETILLTASFLAFSKGELRLPYIILVGTIASTVGDNLGYAIGRWGGRPLLNRASGWLHVKESAIRRGERLFERFGAEAIFFARFVFGMRMIAGPVAGVLRMHWKRFLIYNALGAAAWVTTIASLGYAFSREWRRIMPYVQGANLLLFVLAVLVVATVIWKYRNADQMEGD
jgi:membrane protein DedA with SNARE-associated domain